VYPGRAERGQTERAESRKQGGITVSKGLRRWLGLVGGLVVLAAALIFATSLFAGQGQDLAGTTWRLAEVNGQATIEALDPLTLSFEAEGRMGGNSGCNGFGGAYAVDGGELKLTEIVSTLRACADEAQNEQEAAIMTALQAVAQYEIDGDSLRLQAADGATLLLYTRA
jgi:heat shock protein HslJ